MKMYEDFKKEYKRRFEKYSDQEVIDAFNSQVENQGSGTAKMAFLAAIKEAIIERSIDFSSVGDRTTMSYANCVVLKDKKMYVLDELSFLDVEKIADTWMKKESPAMLLYNAKLTKVDDGQLRFEMNDGHLTTSFNYIIKKTL